MASHEDEIAAMKTPAMHLSLPSTEVDSHSTAAAGASAGASATSPSVEELKKELDECRKSNAVLSRKHKALTAESETDKAELVKLRALQQEWIAEGAGLIAQVKQKDEELRKFAQALETVRAEVEHQEYLGKMRIDLLEQQHQTSLQQQSQLSAHAATIADSKKQLAERDATIGTHSTALAQLSSQFQALQGKIEALQAKDFQRCTELEGYVTHIGTEHARLLQFHVNTVRMFGPALGPMLQADAAQQFPQMQPYMDQQHAPAPAPAAAAPLPQAPPGFPGGQSHSRSSAQLPGYVPMPMPPAPGGLPGHDYNQGRSTR